MRLPKVFNQTNQFLKVLLLIFVSVVIGLLCCELSVRMIYGEKFGRRPGFYIADESLGWKPAPNLHHTFYGPDYQINIVTDPEGYRLGRLGKIDFNKELIVLLGDSFTFGWGVNTDETFASYLDEMVSVASHDRVRVINLGVGGYGTLQYAFSLKEFLQAHPTVKLKAVIVNHCSNDARDNVKSLGYHIGLWKTRTFEADRSRSYLFNFLKYVQEIAALRLKHQDKSVEDAVRKSYLNDNLWTFRKINSEAIPEVVTIERREINLRGLSEKDWNINAVSTPIQKNLLEESVRLIQMLLKNRHIPVVHTFVYQTDENYMAESMEIIKALPEMGNQIIILKGLSQADFDSRDAYNHHSGGHYNADFNKFWAQKVMDRLSAPLMLKTSDVSKQ